ncbi:MAG: DUF4190 domain-containing protein [Oscillochloridaceae bacterium]|nr:DUF4190 domain-containing protein [Chloroflexaceae bacterium]MDW8391837.1 DUF4190 domain-containing protein [Oscillochloridaceae bacterium]
MHCPNCGAAATQGQRFCDNCGIRLGAEVASPEVQPLTPPIGQPSAAPPVPVDSGAYQSQPGMYAPTVVPNSNMAVISLVAGILSWVALPLICALVAVICGHIARKEIRESGGRLSGQGLALAGLILGYANLAFGALLVCLLIMFVIALIGTV